MQNDIFDIMEADSGTSSDFNNVPQEGLRSIAEIARAAQEKEKRIAQLERDLKEAKAEHLKLTDEDLPAMLQELGLNAFELEDGSKINVRPQYGAHINADNREKAFDWLRANGHDGIIKNSISCSFGKGEDEQAEIFSMLIQDSGLSPSQKTEVHSSTLKAWVKERVENGEEFPMELFGAYIGQRAHIRRAK